VARDEPLGLEPLGIELETEMLGAERLPSTCSGPELVEGGRVGGLRHFRVLRNGGPPGSPVREIPPTPLYIKGGYYMIPENQGEPDFTLANGIQKNQEVIY
jgi:hypothetical protein